jgi:hypothetical protein
VRGLEHHVDPVTIHVLLAPRPPEFSLQLPTNTTNKRQIIEGLNQLIKAYMPMEAVLGIVLCIVSNQSPIRFKCATSINTSVQTNFQFRKSPHQLGV